MRIVLERRNRETIGNNVIWNNPRAEVIEFIPPADMSETEQRIAAWDAAAKFAVQEDVRAITVET